MKPAPFDYAVPDHLAEALELLAQHGEAARPLAGGQSLAAMLNMRLVTPRVVVDISRLEELDAIKAQRHGLEVGAAVTQERLYRWPGLVECQPLLHQVLPWVGHYPTRQRGTVCGSIAHSDPSSELPLALAVLGGEVVLQSRRGVRTLPVAEFQLGMLRTATAPDELITAVRFPPLPTKAVSRFREVGQRHGDFALVALAVVADADWIRIGVGGVADVPAVKNLPGDIAGHDLVAALNEFAWTLEGYDDKHASARYRRQLVRRLGKQLIEEARGALSFGT
ncbi:MAG: FAD binding domain-containing protein [Candidatus Competibacterales bacterium]